jgi:hypothetical protein
MQEKYTGVSTYAYCVQNPVRFVDPGGMEKLIWFDPSKDKIIHKVLKKIKMIIQFEKILSTHSNIWKNKKDGENVTIVLLTYNTGNGDDSFAQKMSKEMDNVTIVASDSQVWYSSDEVLCPYKSAEDKNGDVKTDKKGNAKKGEPGNWRVFKDGKEVKQYDNNRDPNKKDAEKDK